MPAIRLPAFIAFALAVTFIAFAAPASAARPGHGPLQLVGENIPSGGELGALVLGTIGSSRGDMCFEFSVVSLSGRIQHIGIYDGAAGFEGPEIVTLNPMPPGVMGLRGCVPVSRDVARQISRDKSRYYVMITTDLYPNGAVRAQLGN